MYLEVGNTLILPSEKQEKTWVQSHLSEGPLKGCSDGNGVYRGAKVEAGRPVRRLAQSSSSTIIIIMEDGELVESV